MSQQFSTIGQIATEPKLFTPAGGAEFCTFRLASTERRFDTQRKEWVDGDTNWFTVNAFRSLAVHASKSFAKGDRIVVTGRLRVRQWERDEKKGISTEIDVDGIGHDVRWGVSSFTKKSAQSDSSATGPTAASEARTGPEHEPGGAETSNTPPSLGVTSGEAGSPPASDVGPTPF